MKKIRIIAFQGTSLRYAYYLDPNDDPLLLVGHVGLQFGDSKIYGFHPPAWALEAEGGLEAALNVLRGRNPERNDLPGTINDDTAIFHLAYRRSVNRPIVLGDRLVVYVMNYNCEDQQFDDINQKLIEWYTQGTILRYGWPPIWETTEFDNCATIQRKLGMSIIDFDWHHGFLDDYMQVFHEIGKRWSPGTIEE